MGFQIASFAVLDLRCMYFLACCLGMIAFGPDGIPNLRVWRKDGRWCIPEQPEMVVPSVLFGFALGGAVWIGKRVFLAAFFHQKIVVDHGTSDAIGTALGLGLLTLCHFVVCWLRAIYAGNKSYGLKAGVSLLIIGLSFASYYTYVHRLDTAPPNCLRDNPGMVQRANLVAVPSLADQAVE